MTEVVNGSNGMPSVVNFGDGRNGYGWDGGRTEQNQANMAIMQSLDGVGKDLLASQASQSASIAANLNALKDVVTAGNMVAAQQLAGVDKDIMENRYLTLQNIMLDGDKTRALIQTQYVDTLNRQLSEAKFDRLYCELDNANQSIRAANQAINFGAGTLTASPTNTSTNNSVR